MINKFSRKQKTYINTEKYTLILLLTGYILGICIGCYYIFCNASNYELSAHLLNENNLNYFCYFIISLILKYSGVLSGAICILPVYVGINNSAYYCSYILNCENKIIFSILLNILKDSALVFLLILYIIVIISQIASKKYNIKKDIKYFIVYFIGAVIILTIEYILKIFIF